MVHQGDLKDFILNTAQMRSAAHIHPLQVKLDPLDRKNTILASVAAEISKRKSGAKGEASVGTSRLQGNIRMGTPSPLSQSTTNPAA